MIIHAGDIPSGVYYIVSGWVKLYELSNSGEPNIIMPLLPGEIFPLAWAINDTLRETNFAALGKTTVLRLPKEAFVEAIHADEAIQAAVMDMLAQHCTRLTDELSNLQYRSARERVAFRLLTLAHCRGLRIGKRVTVDAPISIEYIARSTNMTRETASRELGYFTRKRLISYSRSQITIADMSALQNEVEQQLGTAKP